MEASVGGVGVGGRKSIFDLVELGWVERMGKGV
jgi:hypothetical protein